MMLIIFIILLILIIFLFFDKTCDKQENFNKCRDNCCQQGYYGNKSPNCTKCPANKPSSLTTDNRIQNEYCTCPNADVSSCFACTACEKFNPATGKFILKCPNCKLIKDKGVSKPSC